MCVCGCDGDGVVMLMFEVVVDDDVDGDDVCDGDWMCVCGLSVVLVCDGL